MNSFSSLSYDSLGMVIVAVAVAVMIDMIAQKKVRIWHLCVAIVIILLSFIGAKQNLWLVNILFPISMIVASLQKRNEQRENIYLRRNREKSNLLMRYKWWFLGGILILSLIHI